MIENYGEQRGLRRNPGSPITLFVSNEKLTVISTSSRDEITISFTFPPVPYYKSSLDMFSITYTGNGTPALEMLHVLFQKKINI